MNRPGLIKEARAMQSGINPPTGDLHAQLSRAQAEAGELTAIVADIERRAGFMRRYLPNSAAAVIALCRRGKSYTCGAEFLARLQKAEGALALIRVTSKN